MPELPEVETVVRQLSKYVLGARVKRVSHCVERLRTPLHRPRLSAAVDGHVVEAIARRGKYIVVHMSSGCRLLLHLGMTGTFRVCPPGEPLQRHEHLVVDLEDGRTWRFLDPRKFGMLEVHEPEAGTWPPGALATMGPEPLREEFTPELLFAMTRKLRTPVKVFLMDQKRVAGIGNIYASEILFAAGVRPGRGVGRLTRKECSRVVAETKRILGLAIEAGGTTISMFSNVDGKMGMFVQQLRVYGKTGEPCHKCGVPIRRRVQGGRSTFYCRSCQS